MKNLLSYALALVLGAATYVAADVGTPEAEACGHHEPAPSTNVSGTYESTYGTVVLEQKGRTVKGRYDCCGGGTINGYMSGDTIRFSWQQPGASGRGTWTVDKDKKISGTWGFDGSVTSGGAWNLSLRPTLAAWRD